MIRVSIKITTENEVREFFLNSDQSRRIASELEDDIRSHQWDMIELLRAKGRE